MLVVDDVFADPSRGRLPRGGDRPPTLGEVERVVARLGDRVERVHVPTPGRVAEQSGRLVARLERNAAAIAGMHPGVRGALARFVEGHRRAAGALTGVYRPGIWVVRKGRRAGEGGL